jgi:uncharacterized protein (DUF302 family)
MGCQKIEVERVTITSTRSFEAVVEAIEQAIGRPDMRDFIEASHNAATFAEFDSIVQRSVSEIGLMLFMKLDAGAVLRKENRSVSPKIVRLIIGNPLIMKDMAKHVFDAASYAPITVLVAEGFDGVNVSYDRVAGVLAPYGNAEANAVARELDEKVEGLMRRAAG